MRSFLEDEVDDGISSRHIFALKVSIKSADRGIRVISILVASLILVATRCMRTFNISHSFPSKLVVLAQDRSSS